uniref:NME/NM23 nucleoside diphosphate kinase 6 n=1 Tax=Terrapene triunguis TaxID=2587831 RepID=A0A674K3U9_9SAUR
MGAVLRSARPLQLTLAMLKPDAVAHPLVLEAVHETILNNKFLIVRTKELMWRREDSQRFYQEHSDSVASARREIAFFFPEFSESLWYQQDEPRLRCGLAHYDAEERVHSLPKAGRTESS